jgi:hypothetical protein
VVDMLLLGIKWLVFLLKSLKRNQTNETIVIVSSTFHTQMHSLTPSGTFGFYAAIYFVGWILIIIFYPEVSGLTIDETSQSSTDLL